MSAFSLRIWFLEQVMGMNFWLSSYLFIYFPQGQWINKNQNEGTDFFLVLSFSVCHTSFPLNTYAYKYIFLHDTAHSFSLVAVNVGMRYFIFGLNLSFIYSCPMFLIKPERKSANQDLLSGLTVVCNCVVFVGLFVEIRKNERIILFFPVISERKLKKNHVPNTMAFLSALL